MPKISLSGPADLLTIIPFHLGFQPVRSVVVLCFHGKRLGLVARLDVVDADLATEVVAQTLPTLLTGSPSSVAVVGFEDDAGEALPLIHALAAGFEAERVVVREQLVVRDGKWYAVGCDCCPDEGWLLPDEADVPAVASYVALGHAVLPDRAGLGALVEPLSPAEPRHDLTLAAIEDWQCRYAAAGGPVRDPRQGPRLRPDQESGAVPGAPIGVGRGSLPRVRPEAAPSGPDDGHPSLLDGGDPTARQFLVNDSLVAWGGVLHGDIVGFGLEHWLPSIVGPLRDLQVRDAIVGWLCPGSVPLQSFPAELVAMLEVFLGPDLRVQPAGAAPRPPVGPVPGSGLEPDTEPGPRDVDGLRALLGLLDLEPDRAPDDRADTGIHTGLGTGLGTGWGAGFDGEFDGELDVPSETADVGRLLRLVGSDDVLDADEDDGDGLNEEDDAYDLSDDAANGEGDDERVRPEGLGGAGMGRGCDDWADWDDWEAAATPRLLLARLEEVCRLTPAAHAAPLLSVVASLAWWVGDGARAGVAVDRALELEPDHRLSQLVRESLDHGIRPRRCA
jgi:hypothetical protein